VTCDLDLETFFDRVHHERLIASLGLRIKDRRLVDLIRRMLKAKVVLPDGVVVSTDEGTPQGGPLSPWLSNIVLDALDWELARRGHRFVRYADDSNIYVRSERAGQRVMASVVRFSEGRMRLKVNATKSAVARPEERHFVGFSLQLRPDEERADVLLSKRSKTRIDERIRELTPRNWGQSLEDCITRLNEYLLGWIGFFRICTEAAVPMLSAIEGRMRRRLRALILHDWKRKPSIARRLLRLGIRPRDTWHIYQGRRSWWALSHIRPVDHGLNKAYFAKRGLVSLVAEWKRLQPKPSPPPDPLAQVQG
jgi:group II intron reverse transcriptase/maturase